tara:strand:+ start:506 stop:727 length:222 start_codon:yes stop_codon:yes gene_type:complete
VATQVADRVIKELYDNIISKIPFTSFSQMKAMFSSDNITADAKNPEKQYSLMTELKINFVYPSIAGESNNVVQ